MWPLRRQALKHARSVRRLVNSRLRQHHASLCCRLFATGQGGGSSAHENAGSTAKRSGKYHLGDSNHDKGVLKMRKWDRRQIRNERERRLQVALVGRPNVGKSTLYNRLTREKDAIIHDSPGTTRDWRIGQGVLGDLDFSVIDTGGLEEGPPSSMRGQIVAQCERAVHEAHLVLFMMDARAGVVDMDFQFANWLRRLSGSTEFKTQLVLNKTEAFASEHRRDDFYEMLTDVSRFGLGDCVSISSTAGDGMPELYDVIRRTAGEMNLLTDDGVDNNDMDGGHSVHEEFRIEPVLTNVAVDDNAVFAHEYTDDDNGNNFGGDGPDDAMMRTESGARFDEEPLQFAIIGRPNVGKSTLLNRLIGTERVITGAEPGVTRDAVCVQWEYDGRIVNVVDTAGIQRGTAGLKFQDDEAYIERKSFEAAMAAMRYSHAALLVVDGNEGLVSRTELSIAAEVLKQGRALVVAVNKCDDIPSYDAARVGVEETLSYQLSQGGAVTVVPISALDGSNVEHLMPELLHVFDQWRVRIKTPHLNDWLRAFTRLHGNPSRKRTTYRVKYITQVKSRPPAFTVFANRANMPENYMRALTRGLREEFDLHGVPIRVKTKVGANPYHDKTKQRRGRRMKPTLRTKKGRQHRPIPWEHVETRRAKAASDREEARQAADAPATLDQGDGDDL